MSLEEWEKVGRLVNDEWLCRLAKEIRWDGFNNSLFVYVSKRLVSLFTNNKVGSGFRIAFHLIELLYVRTAWWFFIPTVRTLYCVGHYVPYPASFTCCQARRAVGLGVGWTSPSQSSLQPHPNWVDLFESRQSRQIQHNQMQVIPIVSVAPESLWCLGVLWNVVLLGPWRCLCLMESDWVREEWGGVRPSFGNREGNEGMEEYGNDLHFFGGRERKVWKVGCYIF